MARIKQTFYNISELIKVAAQYNIILGERSNGKSYAVKHYCLRDYINNGNKFVYVRRYSVETRRDLVRSYFEDIDIVEMTNGNYSMIDVYSNEIYLANLDDSGKVVRGERIGRVVSLAGAVHVKSITSQDYNNIIFEEFITDSGYLIDECDRLLQLVSTIARRRQIRVFMVGNTISRLCPYFSEWQLVNIPRQKQGTIDIYNFTTNQYDESGNPIVIKIAVELTGNTTSNSKMFFGSISKSITAGTWETKEQDKINVPYTECKVHYAITVVNKNMIYKLELLEYQNNLFVFCKPAKRITTDRVIQNDFNINPLITKRLYAVTKGDELMIELIKRQKLVYSDNLTGSEFSSIIKEGELL